MSSTMSAGTSSCSSRMFSAGTRRSLDETLHGGKQEFKGFGIEGHGLICVVEGDSAVCEYRRAFVEEGLHAFVGVFAGKAGMQFAAFNRCLRTARTPRLRLTDSLIAISAGSE